jgi:hypothetical protein
MMPLPQFGPQAYPNAYASLMQRPGLGAQPGIGANPQQWNPGAIGHPIVTPPQPVQGPMPEPTRFPMQPPMWGQNPPRMQPFPSQPLQPGQGQGMYGQPLASNQPFAPNNFAALSNLRRPMMMLPQ